MYTCILRSRTRNGSTDNASKRCYYRCCGPADTSRTPHGVYRPTDTTGWSALKLQRRSDYTPDRSSSQRQIWCASFLQRMTGGRQDDTKMKWWLKTSTCRRRRRNRSTCAERKNLQVLLWTRWSTFVFMQPVLKTSWRHTGNANLCECILVHLIFGRLNRWCTDL